MENNASPTNQEPASTAAVPQQAPISPPTTPLHSKRKMMLLGFVAGIGIIALAVGAYTFGVQKSPKNITAITPTPVEEVSQKNPTTDWNTYTDSKSSITFKYPPTWKLTTKPPKEVEESTGIGGLINCTVYLQDASIPTNIIPVDAQVKSSDGTYCWSYGVFVDYTKRSILGLDDEDTIGVSKWKNAVGPNESDDEFNLNWKKDTFQSHRFVNEKMIVTFGLLAKDPDRPSAEKVFDQILSTFKFTNSQTVSRDQVDKLVRQKIKELNLVKDFRVVIDDENNTTWFTSVFDNTKPESDNLVGWFLVAKATGNVTQGKP